MKKITLTILSVFCALIMCTGLIACTDKNSPYGKYELVSATIDGEVYNVEDSLPESLSGYKVRSEDMVVVISKPNRGTKDNKVGDFSFSCSLGGGMLTSGGIYSEADGKITFSVHGSNPNNFEFTLSDDGTLLVTDPLWRGVGVLYTLQKAE